MRLNQRTLNAAVFAMVLLVSLAGCKKKTPVAAAPPPPVPVAERPAEPASVKPAAARINSFTAEPRSIERGQSATLRWSAANATDISIDQNLGAVPANGNRQVFPSNTTTYTLTVRGPGGTDARSVTVDVGAPPAPPPTAPASNMSGSDMLNREAQDAYFDYDKSEVRDDGRAALTHDADLLKRIFAADPAFMAVIEGHCDERGSAEYNLGLGDRRATGAKEFLVQLGVPADRISTISYGKDRPVCTDATEECYQHNRRAHLAVGK
ncbi:MAG: OmpA family protein [Bryobacteraceae bacterium]